MAGSSWFKAGALALGVAVSSMATPSAASAAQIIFGGFMTGAKEAPPNASLGTGSVLVTWDDVLNTMRVQVSFSGLTGNTTNAHIHCCTAVPGSGTAAVATTTPSFVGFPTGVTSGSMDQTYDMTLASSYRTGFITDNGGTVASARLALFTGLVQGRAYFNVHTTAVPAGEIRTFLTTVPEPSTYALMAAGLALLVPAARRRRRA